MELRSVANTSTHMTSSGNQTPGLLICNPMLDEDNSMGEGQRGCEMWEDRSYEAGDLCLGRSYAEKRTLHIYRCWDKFAKIVCIYAWYSLLTNKLNFKLKPYLFVCLFLCHMHALVTTEQHVSTKYQELLKWKSESIEVDFIAGIMFRLLHSICCFFMLERIWMPTPVKCYIRDLIHS